MPKRGNYSRELIRNNMLTQLGETFPINKKRVRAAVFRCDCGNTKVFHVMNVKTGRSRSCGCLSAETTRKMMTTHGQAGKHRSLTYRTWAAMKQRCAESSVSPEYYRDKGIRVCKRWMLFENFVADMGERPSKRHSIDRIDVSGNYEPSNCRWATTAEQARNRTDNRIIEFQGLSMCIADWTTRLGFAANTIRDRLDKLEWTVEAALTTPERKTGKYTAGYVKRCGKWRARCYINGKDTTLGVFKTREEAQAVIDAAMEANR